MSKTCNHEGCKYPCFGGGFCKFHQRDRKDEPKTSRVSGYVTKTKPYKARTTRIKKSTKTQARKEREKAKLRKKDDLFWAEIWQERPHVDFETNEIIEYPTKMNFHHVLPKHEGPGGYPEYRYEKWNIVLVTWDTHTKAENSIDLVPKIKAYRDYLLKTYVT